MKHGLPSTGIIFKTQDEKSADSITSLGTVNIFVRYLLMKLFKIKKNNKGNKNNKINGICNTH